MVKPKILIAVPAGIAAIPGLASACAMCGLSPGDTAGHAFNTSVLFMLAGPYVTVSVVGGLLYLSWRKWRKEAAQHAAAAVNDTIAGPKKSTEAGV